MTRHYRTIAGNLWFFIGAYLVDFGILGSIFFWRVMNNRDGRFGSAAAVILGLLLLTRSRRMLRWHGAIFWLIALLSIIVPVALLLPPVMKWR